MGSSDVLKRLMSLPLMAEIKLVGGNAIAIDSDGERIYESINHGRVINKAVDYINRVGGGKIYIRGGRGIYNIGEQIEVKSNTVISGDYGATLRLANGATFNVFNIENADGVMINGLVIDGNKDNVNYNSAPMYEALNCIRAKNSSNIFITRNILMHSYYFGSRLSDTCKNAIIFGNIVKGFRDQGISVFGSYSIIVGGNIVFNGQDAGYTGGYIGIDIWNSKKVGVFMNIARNIGPAEGFGSGIRCEGSENVAIVGNVSSDNAVDGISAMSWEQYSPKGIMIYGNVCNGNQMGIHAEGGSVIAAIGNIARENTDKGIYMKNIDIVILKMNLAFENSHQNIMIESCNICKLENNYGAFSGGNEGIIILSSTDIDIINNITQGNPSNGIDIRNSSKGLIALNLSKNNNWNGIYLENSQDFMIALNRCYDDRQSKDQDWGIQETGNSNDNIIIYNYVKGNAFGPISKVGANTIVSHNIGYKTENKGIATMPSGSTSVTVSHELALKPTSIVITPLGKPPGLLWIDNVTSSSFDIVTDTAPSSDLQIYWRASV